MCDRQTKIRSAVEAVKAGMAVRQAAREFGVPRTTLRDKIEGKTALEPKAKTFLLPQEEAKFSEWAIHMARLGFGLTRKEFCFGVQEYLQQLGETKPRFSNNYFPGNSWYHDFLKRHPELTRRSPSLLGVERAMVSQPQVSSWFDSMVSYLQEVNDTLLKDPTRIYNVDETGFALCGKTKKVLAPKATKGDRHLYKIATSSKAQITGLCCCSAAGSFVEPLIIMPGQRLTVNPTEHFKECSVGLSESGWMIGDLFANWVGNVFTKFLDENGVKRPVVFFLDGSSIHKSKNVSDACVAAGIIPYCLKANATHLLQPLDLTFFGSLKHHWAEGVSAYQLQNPGKVVTKAAFAVVFKAAYLKAATEGIAKKWFEKAGLFPLNKDAVLNTQKMQPSQVHAKTSPTPTPFTPTLSSTHASSSSTPTPSPTPASFTPSLSLTHASSLSTPTTSASSIPTPSSSTTLTTNTQIQDTVKNLQVLESFLTPDLKTTYERRLQEKYDIRDDVMYNSWKKCREVLAQLCMPPDTLANTTQTLHYIPSASAAPSTSTSINTTGPHISPTGTATNTEQPTTSAMNITTYIETKTPKITKPTKKKLLFNVVPNMALTSVECMEYFERHENEKKEAELKKEGRLKNREEKKKVAAEKKRKAEEKKKEAAEAKKQKMETKRKNGPGGKKGKGKCVKDDSTSEEEDLVNMVLDDSDDDVNLPLRRVNDECYSCEGVYKRSESEDWVGCNKCVRWYHKRCVASIDLLSLNEEQLHDLEFVCDACLCGF